MYLRYSGPGVDGRSNDLGTDINELFFYSRTNREGTTDDVETSKTHLEDICGEGHQEPGEVTTVVIKSDTGRQVFPVPR